METVNVKMKIYTKTGDKGETSLLSGLRVKKSDPRIWVVGEIDELSSVLGLAGNQDKIQHDLFLISAAVVGRKVNLDFFKKRVEVFEKEIDALDKKLSPLHNFISPGGSQRAGFLHLARSVCRRVERRAVEFDLQSEILVYLNRLSDFLFVLGRRENQLNKVKEKILKI